MRFAIAALIFAVTLVAIVTRPRRIGEAWSALIGAGLMVVTGAVSPVSALQAIGSEWNLFLFFLGLMLTAAVADMAGFFDWLDLVRRRPGGHQLPPHRERELAEAEHEGAISALAEAEARARQVAPRVESVQLRGEPGRAVVDLAMQRRVDLIAVRAGGRDQPTEGPRSLGPLARFVADHSPCAVLLLRGS
jgi:nucleotide-binding universal stress UspA family protein